MHPDDSVIDAVTARTVDAVRPLRIILFGSAARGEMGVESDLDLLVVVPDGTHRRRTAQAVHRRLSGLPVSVDVVVATPEDLRCHGDDPGMVFRSALRDGREIYAA
jgi:predicted nucleotidyltransferase